MPFVMFNDQFPILREVDGLSDGAFRLHTSAFFWCARNGTDGFIPAEDIQLVSPRLRAPERFAEECVARRAWHDAQADCGSEHCLSVAAGPGWILHDFLEHNPTGQEMTARKAGKSSGGKLGNHRRWHVERGISDPTCDWCTESLPDRYTDHRTDGGTESHANPSSPNQSSVVHVSSPATGSNGHPIVDDLIIKTVIEAIYERTSRVIEAEWAPRIASEILAGRHPRNPAAYCRQTIMNDTDPVGRFLPVY